MMTRMRALVQALLAAAAVAALVVGVPWGLLQFADWPFTGLPEWEQIQDLSTTTLTDSAVLSLVVVALWAAWVLLVSSLLAEVVVQVRGGLARPMPRLGGPVQRLAGFLVGSIVVGLTPPAAAGAIAAVPVAAAAELDPGPHSGSGLPLLDVSASPAMWTPFLAQDEDDAAVTGELAGSPGHESVTVKHDDTAWSLAERYLGDGPRWREIWELNQDREQADGSRWENAEDDVEAGWRLLLPADAETGEPAVEGESQDVADDEDAEATSDGPSSGESSASEVLVVPGDHFWGIAEQQITVAWGRAPTDAEMAPYWRELVDANRDRLLPPRDPDLIYPEQVFVLPPLPADPLAPGPAQQEDADGRSTGEGAPDAAPDAEDDSEDGREAPRPAGEDDSDDEVLGDAEESSEDEVVSGREEAAREEESDSSEVAASDSDEAGDPDVEIDPDEAGHAQDELTPDPEALEEMGEEDHGPPVEGEGGLPTEPLPDGWDEAGPEGADRGDEPGPEEAEDVPDEPDGGDEPGPEEADEGAGEVPESPDGADEPAPGGAAGEDEQDPEAAAGEPRGDAGSGAPEAPGENGEGVDGSGISDTSEEGSGSSLPVGLIGGGIALAGAVLILDRRRRAQMRRRAKGEAVQLPSGVLQQEETRLRAGADVDGARLVDAAMRAAAAGTGASGFPMLQWVEARSDRVLLMLEGPAPLPPPGFRLLAPDGWETTSDADDLAVMGASAAPPAPTLTPVGTTADGAELLVDLEAGGVVTVDGETDDVLGLLRSMALSVATAPWSDEATVLLVGMEGELLGLPSVEAATLSDALTAAEDHAARTLRALRSLHCSTAGQARATGITPEQWNPLVVVTAIPPRTLAERRQLENLALRTHSAVVVVTPAQSGAAPLGRRLTIGRDGWLDVDAIETHVRPRQMAEDDTRVVVTLFGLAEGPGKTAGEPAGEGEEADGSLPDEALAGVEADTDHGEPVVEDTVEEPLESRLGVPELPELPELPNLPDLSDITEPLAVDPDEVLAGVEADTDHGAPVVEAETAQADLAEAGEPGQGAAEVETRAGVGPLSASLRRVRRLEELLTEVEILVRVLGEVEAVRLADGQEVRLSPTRQKGLEAVTYLALRESAVDREDLEGALFPAGANAAKTVYNTVSAARTLVGDELLPPADDGRYELSERLATDYGLFCELLAGADETDDAAAAADLLADALGLVQGEPFTGVGRSYAWVGAHRGMIVAQVIDAADELAEIRLATGDWRGAEWAARQGLKAFPTDERMYRVLMRTAQTAGNTSGVHRVFSDLCEVIADPDLGVEPEDTLHPETIALLEELTGQPVR